MMPADDEMITLKEASEIFFRGKRTPGVLKDQALRGNLAATKIGGRYFTTITDLKVMVEKCRVKAEGRISGSTKSETDGQSSTVSTVLALRSLQESFRKPKTRSTAISPANTPSPKVTKTRHSQTF
ncbi:hypothetical protein AB8B21_05455 [Tardiphaga sp. 866_E4_N2_1]|uniref:hypothetical protein n=1 Tax=unclassified Tardiphaga TaxID=2631404 RepID=UPI003F1E833E